MKKLLLILSILLVTFSSYSQTTEFNIYVPMRTYHWDRAPIYLDSYHPTEGGNLGAILVLRKGDRIYHDYQVGIMRNSFGAISVVLSYGIGVKSRIANVGINVGIMSGYEKLFKEFEVNIPYGFKPLGILPIVVLNIEPNIKLTFNRFDIKPLFVVSSAFINGGVLIKIK